MYRGLYLIFGFSVFLAPKPLHAQDPSMPTVAQACVACHGANGISPNDFWPNLAGQKEQYLRDSLTAYKTGARKNEVMNPFARTLSEEEIEILVKYYGKLPR